MTPSDEELMQAVRDGDDCSFATLVERHRTPLINFFYRLTYDRQRAEDWTQEVFCRIYEARGGYEPTAQFTTYMYRVARNYWIDCYRKQGRRPKEFSIDESGGPRDADSPGMRDRIAAPGPSPSEAVRRQEVLQSIRDAIDELPAEQRLVFELSEDQGLKYKDISKILDIPVGTVKSRMHAAMIRLREQLKARIFEA